MSLDRARFGRIGLALAFGLAGGGLFYWLGLPLAWMLGPMCLTTAAAVGGARIEIPLPFRGAMIAMLGALLGGAFTPEVLAEAYRWVGGLGVMVGFVAVVTVLVSLWLRKVGRLDPITAYCSATPGGLAVMAIMGEQAGGDPRTIPLIHSTRILLVVFLVPLYLHYGLGFEVPATAGYDAGRPPATLVDLGILGACAGVGYALSRVFDSTNVQLLLPMLLSAAAHISGLVEGQAPLALVAAAQLVMGSSIGARFVGISFAELGKPVLLSIGSSIGMLALAAAVSALFADSLSVVPAALMLALAPGGLAEMALLALAINVDTAFVSTMQIGRILLVVVATPLIMRWLGLLEAPPPTPVEEP